MTPDFIAAVQAVQKQRLRTGQSTEEVVRELFGGYDDEMQRRRAELVMRAVDYVFPPPKRK